MKYNTLHKVSSLNTQDCFTILRLGKKQLDHLLHYHDEYELCLIHNAEGLKFKIGNSEFLPAAGPCLVLTAPGLPHARSTEACPDREITGITMRFPGDLLGENFLGKSQFSGINQLFQQAAEGISFSRETIRKVKPLILSLKEKFGLDALTGLLSLLHELSVSPGKNNLSVKPFKQEPAVTGNYRIDSVFAYMKANYARPILLKDVAKTAQMTRGAFCRFIRKRTGKTYVESLNEIRIAHICRMLAGTTENISEIAYKAGYKNIAYFNRSFRKQKGCTPKEYRKKSCLEKPKARLLPQASEAH